jgi:Concanavalin A-like lectin/glucanases superfamily/Calx-beta domain
VMELDETFLVNLSAPSNATIARAQATGTIRNDEGLPAASVADVSVAEGNSGTTNLNFVVTLSAASLNPVSLSYSTGGGTATAGTDYVAASGTLTIPAGSTSGTIVVTVNGDTTSEGSETLTLTLTAPVNATLARGAATGTISNDDGASGLVAAFSFDEGAGTTALDDSGNGLNGAISGATWSTGRNGGALSFDGVDDWVTVDDHALLDVTRVTVSAWIRPSVRTPWMTVLMKETGTGLAYALYANNDASRPAGEILVNGVIRIATGTAAVATTGWTHLAYTYDGANMRMYVNGVLVRTVARTGNITASTGPLRIGGNEVWGEFFTGLIDDVRVYNRALTLAEVQADMNTPVR